MIHSTTAVMGWDIGGVNTKAARIELAAETAGMRRVLARHPRLDTAVLTGLGDFVAAEAARRMGLGCFRSPTGWAARAGRRRPPG